MGLAAALATPGGDHQRPRRLRNSLLSANRGRVRSQILPRSMAFATFLIRPPPTPPPKARGYSGVRNRDRPKNWLPLRRADLRPNSGRVVTLRSARWASLIVDRRRRREYRAGPGVECRIASRYCSWVPQSCSPLPLLAPPPMRSGARPHEPVRSTPPLRLRRTTRRRARTRRRTWRAPSTPRRFATVCRTRHVSVTPSPAASWPGAASSAPQETADSYMAALTSPFRRTPAPRQSSLPVMGTSVVVVSTTGLAATSKSTAAADGPSGLDSWAERRSSPVPIFPASWQSGSWIRRFGLSTSKFWKAACVLTPPRFSDSDPPRLRRRRPPKQPQSPRRALRVRLRPPCRPRLSLVRPRPRLRALLRPSLYPPQPRPQRRGHRHRLGCQRRVPSLSSFEPSAQHQASNGSHGPRASSTCQTCSPAAMRRMATK